MKMFKVVGAVVGLAVLSSPATASVGDFGRASTAIRIQGFVPVICRVDVSQAPGAPDEAGVMSLGQAREFCNAGRGYRVSISHPTGLDGAALIVDGVRVPLSQTGSTIVTDAEHADIRSVPLAIDPGGAPQKLTYLSFSIAPK